jgi:hypothetical protein
MWQSTKQKVVAQSSCESQYIATTNVTCQPLWLARVLAEVQDSASNTPLRRGRSGLGYHRRCSRAGCRRRAKPRPPSLPHPAFRERRTREKNSRRGRASEEGLWMRTKQEIFLVEACPREIFYLSLLLRSCPNFRPGVLSSVLRTAAFRFFVSVVLRR